jgi:creatinine amidohydrolase/Fe(II)-dependent formamide hydrolase-like protein
MAFQFEYLTSADLDSLDATKTLVVFTCGALEDHGPHLPVSAGLIAADARAKAFVRLLETKLSDWNVVLMPRVPLGPDAATARLKWTQRPHVLRDYLVDSCRRFESMGIRNFLVFSSVQAPRHLTTVEEAGKILNPIWQLWKLARSATRLNLLSVNSSDIDGREVARSPFWYFPLEHSGAKLTSILLYAEPDSVLPIYQELPQVQGPESHAGMIADRLAGRLDGYWGEPRSANRERGEAEINAQAAKDLEVVLPVLKGDLPGSTFRTYYSLIPTNKSNFNAAILGLLICALIVLSYMLTRVVS